MQQNIIWKRIEYYSLENCIVNMSDKGAEINSTIIGAYQNIIYKIDYRIVTNHFWETSSFEIKSQLQDSVETIHFQNNGHGDWYKNGELIEKLNGCIDIDIPLTPFTNTLPINRLKLPVNQSEKIKVLYIDILNQQIKPVHQQYARLSETEYKYENVPNDFEAVITIDHHGLVADYPKLFKRIAIEESHY